MAWGTVTVGGIVFREAMQLADGGASLSLSGQEAHPPLTKAEVRTRHLNVLGLRDTTVPVVFDDKSVADGFYRVTDVKSDLFSFADGAVLTSSWSLTLERLGTERDVEFESRVPTIARADTLTGTQTPEFWHAPPPDHIDYYTGSTVPAATVTRASAEGDVLVYRGIPANVSPRWTCPAGGYEDAAARVLLDDVRTLGTDTPSFVTWEISNGLVRVRNPDGFAIDVSCWGGTAWESVDRYQFFALSDLGSAPTFTILRNDPEEVTVRLTYPQAPGRVTIDLGLRRGARFVTGVMKRHAAATLIVYHAPAVAGTTQTGGIRATDPDADGNRYAMGTPQTVDIGPNGTLGTTATALNFFLGHEVGGTPASGDAFADLLAQYLGTSGDRTRLVRR